MKKIFFCLITLFIFVSCGGSNSSEAAESCLTSGNMRCIGLMLQVCANGTWQTQKQCSMDQTCNEIKGTCDGGNSNNGGSNNGGGSNEGGNNNGSDNNGSSNDDSGNNNGGENNGGGSNDDNGNNNGGGNNGGGSNDDNGNNNGGGNGNNNGGTGNYSCGEIWECQQDCGSDQECQENCFYKGTSEAQSTASTMFGCWNSNCADASDFATCADENCYDETHDCPLYTNTDCPHIYDCLNKCSYEDEDCQQACLDAASSEGNNRFWNLYNCLNENCYSDMGDDEYQDCVYDYCDDEVYSCGYRDND